MAGGRGPGGTVEQGGWPGIAEGVERDPTSDSGGVSIAKYFVLSAGKRPIWRHTADGGSGAGGHFPHKTKMEKGTQEDRPRVSKMEKGTQKEHKRTVPVCDFIEMNERGRTWYKTDGDPEEALIKLNEASAILTGDKPT